MIVHEIRIAASAGIELPDDLRIGGELDLGVAGSLSIYGIEKTRLDISSFGREEHADGPVILQLVARP